MVMKVKLFVEDLDRHFTPDDLEKQINDFIKDKEIVSITQQILTRGDRNGQYTQSILICYNA